MNPSKRKHIVNFIHALTDEVLPSIESTPFFKGIFLAGSFVSLYKNVKKLDLDYKPETFLPDVNYYILIDGGDEDVIKLGYLIHEAVNRIVKRFKDAGTSYNVTFDLHPYSISNSIEATDEDAINFQLTTRIIDGSNPYKYAIHAWQAYKANHVVLYPPGTELFDQENLPAKNIRDAKWFRTLYLALLSYGNILQVLPLHTTEKSLLISETYMYLKEIIKDGVSIAVSDEVLEKGENYKIMNNWKKTGVDFYRKHYGEEAAQIVAVAIDYSVNGGLSDPALKDNPIQFTMMAMRMRNIVFKNGLLKQLDKFTETIDSNLFFEELPLWW